MSVDEDDVVFSPDQEQLFARWFEEGYDLSTDPTYNRWIKENHPEEMPTKEDDIAFSSDQEQLFAWWFEEGYDLSTDPAYNQWQKKNHPESLIMNQPLFADFDKPVVSTSSDYMGSVLEEFFNVCPLNLFRVETYSETHLRLKQYQMLKRMWILQLMPSLNRILPKKWQLWLLIVIRFLFQRLRQLLAKSLSDLLVEHTPKITRNSTQSMPKARLLTSVECLAMLEEKKWRRKKL